MNIFEYKEPAKLTFKTGNPKTDKNLKIEKLKKYWILRLNLAPAKLSGFNTCASASKGCESACLHTAGNPAFMSQKTLGRVNRTRFYFQNRAKFISKLLKEITNHEVYCFKNGFKPVVRLNTTSDIPFEIHGIFELFPNIQFYDYTKIKKRALKFAKGLYPKNYHLTFSLNEENYNDSMDILKAGGNVAVVFRHDPPKTYKGFKVIKGDEHDLRFTDPKNVIVGLKEKLHLSPITNKLVRDYSGFVIEA